MCIYMYVYYIYIYVYIYIYSQFLTLFLGDVVFGMPIKKCSTF